MELLSPLTVGALTLRNRVMFGPVVTNLGTEARTFSDRHVAFYERRARGGCGLVVTEGASVHDSDWPYERAPLADRCTSGWEAIVAACATHGCRVVASLDHAGGQGSSAYSQSALWAPSRVPEVNSREVPKWMEPDDIAAVVGGFAAAARAARGAGCAGVEINAGQHSLVRQFLSGLTNHRDDEWGQDRLRFARDVLAATRDAVGADGLVGLRLSCDELAPWAGITPEMAPGIAAELCATGVDYLVVVRGSIFSAEKTRPDFHEPAGFNVELCHSVRAAVRVPVFLQGSVVDAAQAEWAIADGVCDAVEMTRAQLADADLVVKLAGTHTGRARPCILCNQVCQVRDPRNPVISCVGEPSTGHEATDPRWDQPAAVARRVLVVGGGPAGLETARVAARRGHTVRLVERGAALGGAAVIAGPGAALVEWLEAECRDAGVQIEVGVSAPTEPAPGEVVVSCTGSVAAPPPYLVAAGATVVDVADVRRGMAAVPTDGTIVVVDPIGAPIAVSLAEELGARAVLVTQDHIAGNELSRSGDLAPANTRLQQRGVRIERRTLVREVHADRVVVEDRFSGARREIEAAAVVDCGFRLPAPPSPGAHLHAGDCVAPRTLYEAVLEGRRAARAVDTAALDATGAVRPGPRTRQ